MISCHKGRGPHKYDRDQFKQCPECQKFRDAYANRSEKRKASHKKWLEKNRDRVLAWQRAYRATRFDHKFYMRLYKYGVAPEVLKEKIDRQKGCCAICGEHKGLGGKGGLALDHNHRTNQVRDLLCTSCNVGVGVLERDPAWLAAALEYLLSWAAKDGQPDTLYVQSWKDAKRRGLNGFSSFRAGGR